LAEAPCHPGPGAYGRQEGHAVQVLTQLAFQRVRRPAEKPHGAPIVADGLIRFPQEEAGPDLQGDVPSRAPDGERTLARLRRLRAIAHEPEMLGHERRDPSEPTLIVQIGGDPLRLAEASRDLVGLGEQEESGAEAQAERDLALTRLAGGGQTAERLQGLLEA